MDGTRKNHKARLPVFAVFMMAAAMVVFFFEGETMGQELRYVNLPYGHHPQQVLDVYTPSVQPNEKLPVIVYVHGGGWSRGSKSNVAEKPALFMANGYVFVSVGYRLFPNATYKEMAGDVAEAVKWVYDHADDYQIDRTRINLMGHSAGGHLVSLVGTNPDYLANAGLSLSSVKSIVNLEGPINIAEFVQRFSRYKSVFGENRAVLTEASPDTYAAKQNLPPIFFASRRDSSLNDFFKKVHDAGNTAEYFECKTLTHRDVTKLIGSHHVSTEAEHLTDALLQFFKKYN